MVDCEVSENSVNSSNMNAENNVEKAASTSAPSTPLKRKTEVSSTLRVMAQNSSRKLQKIEENSIASLTEMAEKTEFTVKDLDSRIKSIFHDTRVLSLVSTPITYHETPVMLHAFIVFKF